MLTIDGPKSQGLGLTLSCTSATYMPVLCGSSIEALFLKRARTQGRPKRAGLLPAPQYSLTTCVDLLSCRYITLITDTFAVADTNPCCNLLPTRIAHPHRTNVDDTMLYFHSPRRSCAQV
jgi:hypothetical protein